MPHSSGGGSHGGGSHGGSHHHSSHSRSRSGSSSSTPARRTGSTSFAGAKRYMYYRNHRPVFVYANYDIRKEHKNKLTMRIVLFIFFIVPSLFMTASGLFLSGHFPKKLEANYDTTIVIEDNLGIIQDENGLRQSLQNFYDTTGITPAVAIYPNDVWKDNYSSLEDYAYEDYLTRFNDEKHWLIVYTTELTKDGFEDWNWEAMQGDDTDEILTSKETSFFISSVHDKLLQPGKYSVDGAIAEAFDELTPIVMKKYLSPMMSIVTLIFESIFIGVILLMMDFHPIRENNYKKAVECDPKFVDQEACEYCGGIYVIGMQTTCPHCGAPVKPHDYTMDEEGNITQIIN